MKTKLIALLGLSGLALVGLVSSAAADIVEVIFTGTVVSSNDPDGTFGCTTSCTDNPYKGYTYTATYIFNTSIGMYSIGEWQIGLQGGSLDAPILASPLISDSVTISEGSITDTYTMDATQNASLFMETNGQLPNNETAALPYIIVATVSDALGNEIYNSIQSSSLPFSLTENFGPLSNNSGNGYVTFDCNGMCPDYINADLTVSLKILSTVPEPSTWMLMLVGFAGLGAIGYRNVKSGRSAFSG
jgi:hypothetical protein